MNRVGKLRPQKDKTVDNTCSFSEDRLSDRREWLRDEVELIELTLRLHELEGCERVLSGAEHRWWWLRGGCWTGAIFDRVVLNKDVLRSMIVDLSGV